MTSGIGLQAAIQAVREDLIAAMAVGAGEPVRFRVGTVSLEFNVTVERAAEAGGGIRVWVLQADARGKMSTAETHVVRVELQPVSAGGGDVEVADVERVKPR